MNDAPQVPSDDDLRRSIIKLATKLRRSGALRSDIGMQMLRVALEEFTAEFAGVHKDLAPVLGAFGSIEEYQSGYLETVRKLIEMAITRQEIGEAFERSKARAAGE